MDKQQNLTKITLKLFWQQIKKHKLSFFIALLSIPISIVTLNTLMPLFLSNSIGNISNKNNFNFNLLLAIISGTVGVILNFIGFKALTLQEASVRSRISNHNFEKIINKDMSFFINQKLGALTSRFIDFGNSHVQIQDLIIMQTLGLILGLSSTIIILFFKNWQIALLFVIFIILMTIEILWSLRKRKIWRQQRRDLRAKIYGQIADNFTNSLLVKTFAQEKTEIKKIKKLNQKHKKAFIKDIGFVSSEGSFRVALMFLVQVGLVYYSSVLVQQGLMTTATIIFILIYTQKLSKHIFILSRLINGFTQAFMIAEPMTKILIEPKQIIDIPSAKKLKINQAEINFSQVNYQYPDNNITAIKDFNLAIKAGQKVGVVGHSGAGKSTLVHLLLRFFDPDSGAIKIDNQNIAQITQESLHKSIAFVPQDSMLFHRSIKDNVRYGKPKATEAEIIKACKQANAWEFIKDLPDGLDTMVGERGVKLSGGQRQRVAIARAILKNSPILILDEATSALDSQSEKLIQASFENLMKDRTSIVIAHRLSTIAKLDRIIVLDKGKIVEDGTHEELLERNGIYAKLWQHQSGGFIE